MLNSCNFTEFGLFVKTELLKRGMTQKQLENMVSERTGLYVDGGYMHKILTGKRNAPKITKAISEILGDGETDCHGPCGASQ